MDFPIQDGQHYESGRGYVYTVEYHNDDIVILHDGTNYRLEKKHYFVDLVDAGRFELKPDLEINTSEVEIPLIEIPQIGEVTVESMVKEGFTTPQDIDRCADDVILECDGLGEAGLNNIRDWIRENT